VILTLSKKTSSSAFALSLAGGILIILGSIVSLLFFAHFWSSMQDRMGGMIGGGMMGGGMMGGGMMSGWFLSIPIVAGTIVLIGAIILNFRAEQNALWGIIIIIFSIVGFTGMGISFLGSILGIIGGALALSRR
jgi:hypothetical protein